MTATSISSEKFEALRQKLIMSHQAEVTGTNEGRIVGHGVTANYRYDEAAQTLTVDVQHHPFFISVAVIEGRLREELQ